MKNIKNKTALVISLAMAVSMALTACGSGGSSQDSKGTTADTQAEATTTTGSETASEAPQTSEPETTTTTEQTTNEQTTDSSEAPDESSSAEQENDIEIGEKNIALRHFGLNIDFPDGWSIKESSEENSIATVENQQSGIALSIQWESYDTPIKIDDYIANVEKTYNDILSQGDAADPMAMKNLTFDTQDAEKDGVKGKKHLTSYTQRGVGNVYIYEYIFPDSESKDLLFMTFAYDNEEALTEIESIMG